MMLLDNIAFVKNDLNLPVASGEGRAICELSLLMRTQAQGLGEACWGFIKNTGSYRVQGLMLGEEAS